MNFAPFVFAAARQADRDPEGCAGCLAGGLWLGFWLVVARWLLPEEWGDWTAPGGIVLSFVSLVTLAVGSVLWNERKGQARTRRMPTGRKTTPARFEATASDGFREETRSAKVKPSGGRASRPASPPRGFKPAKSGNGFTRSLNIDGWWTNCWVGRTRGVQRAKVFAPSKNGIQVQEAPLMERDCHNEGEAFAWLRDAEASGQIREEALRAISRFEKFENNDNDIPF